MISSNDSSFQSDVLSSQGLVLVDFWADWCGPCQRMLPILQTFSVDETAVKVVKINVDDCQITATNYGIRSIPTLILFKNGNEVDRKVGGAQLHELKSWVAQYK